MFESAVKPLLSKGSTVEPWSSPATQCGDMIQNGEDNGTSRHDVAVLQIALDLVDDAVFFVDPDCLKVQSVNQAARRICRRSEIEIINRPFVDLFAGDARESVQRALEESQTGTHSLLCVLDQNAEIETPIELSIQRVAVESASCIVVSARDLSERRRVEQMMRTPKFSDPLTGLADRRVLDEALHVAWNEAEKGHQGFAVIFVDLDDFRFVNDSLGHPAGDEVLRTIGRRIRRATRADDVVTRYGGDEFVVLVQSVGNDDSLRKVSARIDAAISKPVWVRDVRLVLSASMGMARDLHAASSPADLIEWADRAMYEEKRRHRSRGIGVGQK